jgi:hypothetical protein
VKHISSKRFDRVVRLEMLRAQAAIQRDDFAGHIEQLSVEASPLHLLGSVINFRRKSWFKTSTDFLAHYPLVVSTISTFLMGRTSRLARGSGLVLVLLQAMLAQQGKKPPSDP